MTNNSDSDLTNANVAKKPLPKTPAWVWALLVVLGCFVGYQWLRKPPTRLHLTGKHDLFWFASDKIYVADTSGSEQAQIWVAPQAGGTFQKALTIPYNVNPEGIEITKKGVYSFALLDNDNSKVEGELTGPTEYQLMMGDRAYFRRILKHLEGEAWEHPIWAGFTNVMRRNLSFFSWDGKVQEVNIGRKQARPVDYVFTPETLFWVNANPMVECYYLQDGQYRYVGRRGQSELVAVNRKTGKAETVARDLHLMTKNSAIATDGESVYWLDLISATYKAGRFFPHRGVRLCRYSPRTKQVTLLQEFPESAGIVALPKMPMILREGRIHFLISSFVRSPLGGIPLKTIYTACSCDTNGQNLKRRDFELTAGGVEITHWRQEKSKIWLSYSSGTRIVVGKLDLETQTPLETVYRSAQDDSARGIGFGTEAFFYRQHIQSEHWGKWAAKDLEVEWDTRIGSYALR